jgi:hypothetical protein
MRSNARTLLLIGAAAALAACGTGQGANNAADAALEAANMESTATGPAELANAGVTDASAPSDGFNAAFMVGKWSAIDEDCSDVLEFREDGTVVTPIGEAKWTVASDKLTIDYGDEASKPTVSTIKVLEPNRIEITHASGTKETERRC